MKHLLLVVLLLAFGASAQTVTTGPVTRHAGAGTGAVLSTHADLPGCVASAVVGTSTCKVRVVKTAAPAPAPAPAPASEPMPAPASVTYYFSDCQAGAAAGCVPGSNANPGTQAAPKQNLAGFNINALPAGATLLFARGGAWNLSTTFIENMNATLAAPIVFDAYGTGAAPALGVSTGVGVFFGAYGSTRVDGGYVFRNLKLDGRGTATWGFFVQGATRGVVIEDNEITGFEMAVHMQNGAAGNSGVTIRRNNIHHNSAMGILGDANDLVLDANVIEANNFSGSGFDHGVYLGGHATNGRVTNNRFVNNSQVNGVCTGGNLTVHGQWTGLLIEGNTITTQGYAPGCWGISVNDGYTSAEFFRGTVIRGNDVRNVQCGACVRAAPGVVIEGNTFDADAAVELTPPNGADDDPGAGGIVRNNRVCRGTVRASVASASVSGTTSCTP